MDLEIVILAAGKGTRMRSERPKVLHSVAAKPLLEHVVTVARTLTPRKLHIVVGHGADQVEQHFRAINADQDIVWARQEQQLGTGHAVQQAMANVDPTSAVLVLYGDVPLTPAALLKSLVDSLGHHRLALLTVVLDLPAAYGRIVRDPQGRVARIVEAKDASDAEREIKEINTGIMLAQASDLNQWLPKLNNQNNQGEYYLTDIVALAAATEGGVTATIAADEESVVGVNSLKELALVERVYQRRCAEALMQAGLTLADPARFDLRGELTVGAECFVDINTIFEGQVRLGDRVRIGANTIIRDSEIADDAVIEANCIVENARVGAAANVGPYARLRPGAQLDADVRVGNFVEIKNSHLRAGSKANHLAYVGDSSVGAKANLGAGTITCNYDGVNKHRTEIGEGAFIGSNTALVAPVSVGAGAVVGAGSTIAKNAPADQLTLTRAKQTTIPGWRKPNAKVKSN